MATCTIGFRNPDYGDYTDLSFDEAREAVMEEIKKSIQDQGSDDYDLVWPEEAGEGDEVSTWLDSLADEAQREQITAEAHERGVILAAQSKFTPIWSDLMLNNEATLPGGTVITYEEHR